MKIFFTAIITFLLLMSEAQAAKIDSYREIISSGRFTIKYTLTEPPARVTNKEATLLSGFFGSDFQMTNTSAVQIRDLNNHTGALHRKSWQSRFEKERREFQIFYLSKTRKD